MPEDALAPLTSALTPPFCPARGAYALGVIPRCGPASDRPLRSELPALRPPLLPARVQGPDVNVVELSACGTLLAAVGAHNRAVVWDVRRTGEGDAPPALHVLSHGRPARSHGDASSTVGVVDSGDEGGNALAWFHGSPCLVTGGATGVGLWDTRLGAPCVLWQPLPGAGHLRCINTAGVHASDRAFVTGGDDQRVVLSAPEGPQRLALPRACR